MQFYTILTQVGSAKIANATALKQSLKLKSIAIGDGNGNYPDIKETDTALVHEVYRSDIIDFSTGAEDSTQVTVESYVPSNVGDFYVREVGVYDEDGDLVAIGIYPETYKPILTSGAAKDLKLRIVLEVGNADVVTVEIDPNIIVASRSWVNGNFMRNEEVHKFDTSVNGTDINFTLPTGIEDNHTVAIVYQDEAKTASVNVSCDATHNIANIKSDDVAEIKVLSITKFIFDAEKSRWNIIKGGVNG